MVSNQKASDEHRVPRPRAAQGAGQQRPLARRQRADPLVLAQRQRLQQLAGAGAAPAALAGQQLGQGHAVGLPGAVLDHGGDVGVAAVIEDCPWEADSMTLAELLTSQRRWGRTRARKLLQTLALSENKRIGSLTPRQRALLTSALSGPRPRDTVLV